MCIELMCITSVYIQPHTAIKSPCIKCVYIKWVQKSNRMRIHQRRPRIDRGMGGTLRIDRGMDGPLYEIGIENLLWRPNAPIMSTRTTARRLQRNQSNQSTNQPMHQSIHMIEIIHHSSSSHATTPRDTRAFSRIEYKVILFLEHNTAPMWKMRAYGTAYITNDVRICICRSQYKTWYADILDDMQM